MDSNRSLCLFDASSGFAVRKEVQYVNTSNAHGGTHEISMCMLGFLLIFRVSSATAA